MHPEKYAPEGKIERISLQKTVLMESSGDSEYIDENEKAAMRFSIEQFAARVESLLNLSDNEILVWAINYHQFSKDAQESSRKKIEKDAKINAARLYMNDEDIKRHFGADFGDELKKINTSEDSGYDDYMEKLETKFINHLLEENREQFILTANITVFRLEKSKLNDTADWNKGKYCPNINFVGNAIWQKGSDKKISSEERAKNIANLLK
jgi:hypothetical protein